MSAPQQPTDTVSDEAVPGTALTAADGDPDLAADDALGADAVLEDADTSGTGVAGGTAEQQADEDEGEHCDPPIDH